jgi:hypothetical protein
MSRRRQASDPYAKLPETRPYGENSSDGTLTDPFESGALDGSVTTRLGVVFGRNLVRARAGLSVPALPQGFRVAPCPLSDKELSAAVSEVLAAYDMNLETLLIQRGLWGSPAIDLYSSKWHLPSRFLSRRMIEAALGCLKHSVEPTAQLARFLKISPLRLFIDIKNETACQPYSIGINADAQPSECAIGSATAAADSAAPH